MPLVAITHAPSPRMTECIRTFAADEAIDLARAHEQHRRYRETLSRAGASVVVLEANRDHPDSVFIEDTAIVLDEVAVLTSMGAPSRRAEPAGVEAELEKYRNVVSIQAPATIEGGDVLRVGRTVFVGVTSRTNRAGIDAFREIAGRFGYELRAVRTSSCLHLKSACTALPDGRLLGNPRWLESGDLHGFEMVAVPETEAHAANVLLVGDRVVMPRAWPETARLVEQCGFTVDRIDVTEFAKADGCVTCLSLLVSVP